MHLSCNQKNAKMLQLITEIFNIKALFKHIIAIMFNMYWEILMNDDFGKKISKYLVNLLICNGNFRK